MFSWVSLHKHGSLGGAGVSRKSWSSEEQRENSARRRRRRRWGGVGWGGWGLSKGGPDMGCRAGPQTSWASFSASQEAPPLSLGQQERNPGVAVPMLLGPTAPASSPETHPPTPQGLTGKPGGAGFTGVKMPPSRCLGRSPLPLAQCFRAPSGNSDLRLLRAG